MSPAKRGVAELRLAVAENLAAIRTQAAQTLLSSRTAAAQSLTAVRTNAAQQLGQIKTSVANNLGQARQSAAQNLAGIRQTAATNLGQTRVVVAQSLAAIRVNTARELATIRQNASQSLSALGSQVTSVGRRLTVGLTLPLIALAGVSVKAASDIDAQVNTLKAFTGSAGAAEKRLAQLIATSRKTPGLTSNLALTLDAQLRTARATEQTIDRVLPAIGRLNAVSKLPDAGRFVGNLQQLVTQNFERQDLKELVGQSPLAGQLIADIFNVDNPTNAKAIRESAKKLGINTVDEFFAAFAEAAERNEGLATVTESIGTRFEKLFDRINFALRPLGLSILSAIEPYIEPVAQLIERASEAFNSLAPPVKTAILVIGAVVATLGPVLVVAGGIITALSTVVIGVGVLSAAVGGLAPLFVVIASVVAAVVLQLAAAAAAAVLLYNAWQSNFGGLRDSTLAVVSVIREHFARLVIELRIIYERVLPSLQSVATRVITFLGLAVAAFGRLIVPTMRGISEAVSYLVRQVGDAVDVIAKLIDGDFQGVVNALVRLTINAVRAAGRGFDTLKDLVGRALDAALRAVGQAVARWVGAARNLATNFVTSLASSIRSNPAAIASALTDLLLTAAAMFNPANIARSIGARIGASIREGIRSAVQGEFDRSLGVGGRGGANFGGPKIGISAAVSGFDSGGGGGNFGGGGGRGGGGSKKDRAAQLAEQELARQEQAEAARAQDATEEIRREYEVRVIDLRDYLTRARAEVESHYETEQRLLDEREAFVKRTVKDARERALELRKLGDERIESDRRRNRELQKLGDEEVSKGRDAENARAEALSRIEDAAAEKRIAAVERAAALEYKAESEAAAEVGRLRLEMFDRNVLLRQRELAQVEEGSARYRQIQGELGAAEIERGALIAETAGRVEAAKRKEAETYQSFLERIRDLTRATAAVIRDAGRVALESSNLIFTNRREYVRRLSDLRRQEEAEQHEARLEEIRRELEAETRRIKGLANFKELELQLIKKYNELIDAERARFDAGAAATDTEEARELDPLIKLRDQWEQFKSSAINAKDSIAESVQSIVGTVVDAAGAMEGALRQSVVAFILTGESIGKALKAALAQQLATLSAEFIIQALRHAAYALGSLAFGNFGAAAAHAKAAAAFTAAAVATGFAARGLAKGAAAASSATGGAIGGGEEEREARDREFQYGSSNSFPSSDVARDGSGTAGGNFWASLRAANERQALALEEIARGQSYMARELARINGIPAGQVLSMGLDQNPTAVPDHVVSYSDGAPEFNRRLLGNLGFSRA